MAQRKLKKKELPYVCADKALSMIRSGGHLLWDNRDGPEVRVLVDDEGRVLGRIDAYECRMLLKADGLGESESYGCYKGFWIRHSSNVGRPATLASQKVFKEMIATSLRRWMESISWDVHWHNGK